MKQIIRAIAAAALLCASVAHAAVVTPVPKDEIIKLMRGSSQVTRDPRTVTAENPQGDPLPVLTHESCPSIRDALYEFEGLTREAGGSVYKCVTDQRAMVTFRRNPPPTCGDRPAPDEHATRTCPAGTVGTWQQDRLWTLRPYPECWVQGDWTPAAPPEGMCAPADSDGDGVPDSTDQCPTVYASTPNGCPATPPAQLAAPTNVRAQGISTNSIRVTWDAVPDAAAYSLERCIGATCTGFWQLICVQSTSGTHSHLPANLTARYRVRASRDAACGTAVGNLGQFSTIVSGTTLTSSTPVDCAVSAWGVWSAAAWSVCTNGQQSRSETRTRTVTTSPANGGAICPALTETRTTTQPCSDGGGSGSGSGTASLSWTPPTHYTNGDRLTDIRNYVILFGQTQGGLSDCAASITCRAVETEAGAPPSFSVANLTPGTWYFAVRAVAASGVQSANSNISSKIVQ